MTVTVPERLARLETQMEHVESTLGDIRKTQLEIRDGVIGRAAVHSAAKSGLSLVKAVGPSVIAIGGAAAAVIGLR
jgi:hypothetical protein